MHVKIMKKAAKALSKDAAHYGKEAKKATRHHKTKKAKHELVEKKEASSAAKSLRKRAVVAHEY